MEAFQEEGAVVVDRHLVGVMAYFRHLESSIDYQKASLESLMEFLFSEFGLINSDV